MDKVVQWGHSDGYHHLDWSFLIMSRAAQRQEERSDDQRAREELVRLRADARVLRGLCTP